MTTIPLAEARAHLSRLVEQASTTHERVEITKNGVRSAVLLGAEDYDAMLETLNILADAQEVADLRTALDEARAGAGPRPERRASTDAHRWQAAPVTYRVTLSHQARRALTADLPETIAAACFAFIDGPLADNPQRVGKALHQPLDGLMAARRGEFRVIYSPTTRRSSSTP